MVYRLDTIAAIATPPGRGSIGVVRISGYLCKKIYQSMVGGVLQPRIAAYVSFKQSNSEIIDKGIAIYFKSPASYTGEDVLECYTHGSQIVLGILLEEIITLGARLARPGEFTERAFMNDKLDLIQAEAVADLIDSRSKKAARSALKSLNGFFSKQVCSLREDIFKARALIESGLDFPEEDIDVDISPAIKLIKQCLIILKDLLAKTEAGRILDQSPSVVIVGSPNVGKSSIINLLSGHEVAIVSSIPGTTRDVVRESVLLNGNPVTLIDTAGIRDSGDEIEQEGMHRAYKALASADLVLFIYDASLDQRQDGAKFKKYLPAGVKAINVWNKIDLCGDSQNNQTDNDIYVSAKMNIGMIALINLICKNLKMVDNEEDTILARQRHIEGLYAVKNELERSLINFENAVDIEVLAEDLRCALTCFDEITGKTTTDDLLGEIFSRFCIGK